MRINRLLISIMAGSVLSVIVHSPASAVSDVEAFARDLTVRYDGCKTTPVIVRGDWDTDAYNEIRVVVRAPAGGLKAERTFTDDYDGEVRMNVRLCSRDKSGKYSIKATAIGYDESLDEESRAQDQASFRYTFIPKKKTRIRHRVIHTPNQPRYKYVVPGQLLRDGRGVKGQRVLLLARISGDWYKISSGLTKKQGYFAWQFEPNNFRWRYFYRGNASTKPSVSDVFRTPHRSSGRTTAKVAAPTLEQARDSVKQS